MNILKMHYHDYVDQDEEKQWDFKARKSLMNTFDEIHLFQTSLRKRVEILEAKIKELEVKDE